MNALILSANTGSYSTARLKQELVKRDHQVRIHCFNCYPIGEEFESSKELNDFQYDFVFPRLGAKRKLVADQFLWDLEQQGIRCLNSYKSLRATQSKLRMYQILTEHNLPVPKTWISKGIEGFKDAWLESDKSQLVIKGIRGAHGNSIFLSPNLETAKRILNLPEFLGTEYLIQEYVSESAEEDIRAVVVGDKVVASVRRINESLETPLSFNGHPDMQLESVQLNPLEEVIVLRAAKSLSLDVAGVNLVRSYAGPLVLEVNSAPGLEGIESVSSVNIAGRIVEHAELMHYSASRHSRRKVQSVAPTAYAEA